MPRTIQMCLGLAIVFCAFSASAECDPPITDRYVIDCCLTEVCVGGRTCPPCFWDLPIPMQSSLDDLKLIRSNKGEKSRQMERPRFVPIRAMCGSLSTEKTLAVLNG